MNYTEKYHLPQWEESDRVMRADFNQMCADLEAGIARAQETAEALPFVTGSYRGNGTSQHIEVGFTPRILLIGQATTTNDINAWGGCSLHVGTTQKVQMSATGFYAFSGNTFPITNKDGFYYSYVAFR
ncbi:MAG: hypothetical protein HFF77_10070 [Oscillospiraceae bacterium]|nr:hypothetical protein [Oscillospiraceae bacterium]